MKTRIASRRSGGRRREVVEPVVARLACPGRRFVRIDLLALEVGEDLPQQGAAGRLHHLDEEELALAVARAHLSAPGLADAGPRAPGRYRFSHGNGAPARACAEELAQRLPPVAGGRHRARAGRPGGRRSTSAPPPRGGGTRAPRRRRSTFEELAVVLPVRRSLLVLLDVASAAVEPLVHVADREDELRARVLDVGEPEVRRHRRVRERVVVRVEVVEQWPLLLDRAPDQRRTLRSGEVEPGVAEDLERLVQRRGSGLVQADAEDPRSVRGLRSSLPFSRRRCPTRSQWYSTISRL